MGGVADKLIFLDKFLKGITSKFLFIKVFESKFYYLIKWNSSEISVTMVIIFLFASYSLKQDWESHNIICNSFSDEYTVNLIRWTMTVFFYFARKRFLFLFE